MPYIGRELDRGNYLKLDDISSTFDSSTTTFNLTNGGKAFYPGSAFSILVILAGVVQEPETAYQINQAQITFASAPLAGDQFFCIVLGQALGVNIPANGSVNGAQLAKPFNYDGYFYLDDANNRVGIATATPQKPLHVVGEGQFDSVRVLGDLTVDGTTTTLDTVVTEVDKLEVGANNNTVGVAITQSGTGDILNLYDGATEVFTVTDGGKVGIEAPNPSGNLNISYLQVGKGQVSSDHSLYNYNTSFTNNAYQNGNGTFAHITSRAVGVINIQDNVLTFSNGPGGTAGQSATLTERLRITSGGNIGIGTDNPTSPLHLQSTSANQNVLTISANNGRTAHIKSPSVSDSNTPFIFYTNNAWRFDVDSIRVLTMTHDYKVGIGTENPQSQFEVYGSSPIIRSKHSTSQAYTQINHNGTDGYVDWSAGGLIFRGASNAERLRIHSNSNVGIKNTSPNNTLTVGDTVQPSYAPSSAGNYIEIARTSGADAGLLINKNTGQWLVGIDNSDGANAPLRFEYGAAGSAHPGFGSANPAMMIKHDGKIGIGTDNPARKVEIFDTSATVLQLNSTNSGGTSLRIQNSGTDKMYMGLAGDFIVGQGNNVTDSAIRASGALLFASGGGTERLRIDSNGYLGLNNSAPHNQYYNNLVIGDGSASGDKGITIRTQSSNEGVIAFSDADSGAARYAGKIAYNHGTNAMMFFTANGDERLRVASDGQVLLNGATGKSTSGTSATDLLMANNAAIRFRKGDDSAWINSVGLDSNNNLKLGWGGSTSEIHFGISGIGDQMKLDSGGRLIIGSATSSNAWLGGDDLIIGNTTSGTRSGITLVSGSDTDGGLYWSDGNSGTSVFQGQLVYNHSNSRMQFYTAGTSRVTIDSVGRLLIGRATPLASSSERLTVDSGMSIFRNNSTGTGALYLRNEDSTADTRHPYLIFTDGSGNRGGIGIQNDASSMWIHGQNGIAFRTSGTSPGSAERLRIDSGGRLGLGVVPEAYHANNKAVIRGDSGYAILGRSDDNLIISQNFYYDSSDAGKYIANGEASAYQQSNGAHTFYNASSGSANGSASLVERFQIQSDGRVSIGAPAANALGALHIHANQGTDTALWVGDSSTNRYIAINEQGSTQNFSHINTRYNDNGIHAHYIIDNPYANAAGYGSQILFRGYNNGTTAYIETSNEAASTARGTLRLRGADNHGLDVRSTGEVSTTHASNIGYETNAATNTRSLVYTSLDPQKQSTSSASWFILKTFYPNKSGRVNIHADMYITSGTYYFSFRVREEGTDTIVFNAGDNGGYGAYENPSGQSGNVHSYKTYKWICPLIKAHKRYYIEMAATNAAGTSVNSNANQEVFLKNLYIYSMSGGHSDSTGSMLIQQGLDEATSTANGGTTRAAMNTNINRDSLNQLQYFAGTESTFLGWFTSRAYNRYLDIELNMSGSYMWFAQAYGYLYDRGQTCGSMISGYTYTNNQILNKYSHTFGNRGWYGSYRTSGGNLCLKFDSGSNGYSEGRIAIFFGTHGPTQPQWRVLRYRQNDTTNNIF